MEERERLEYLVVLLTTSDEEEFCNAYSKGLCKGRKKVGHAAWHIMYNNTVGRKLLAEMKKEVTK